MRSLRAWMRRIADPFVRDRRDRELDDELASHLQLHIDDNLRAGMSSEAARRHALVALGGLEPTKERYRDRRGLPVLDQAFQDIRFAARLMRRSPGFTLVAVVALALGIGANTVMFSVVNTVFLRPLPYPDADRLLYIETIETARGSVNGTSPPDFTIYRDQQQTLERLAAFYTRPSNLTGGAEPERVSTLIASADFFATLGVQPSLGRSFLPSAEQWGSHRVVVLTDGLWRRRFGADPRIIGRTITVNTNPFVVIGVLPKGFSFLGWNIQMVVPMAFAPGDDLNSRGNYFLSMIGRLRPHVERGRASDDLNRLSNAIIRDHPENKGTALRVVALQEMLVKDIRRAALVMLAAVAFVLLIACANVANMLLARAASRRPEIVMRTALGASRGRLVRQFLTESVLLALAGGAAGLALSAWAIRAINLLSQQALPRVEDVRIDPLVLTFTGAIAMTTGILFGLAPALTSGEHDSGALAANSARAGDSRGRRFRGGLIAAEVALCVVLLAGAGLMTATMGRLLRADVGFRGDHVATMQVSLPFSRYVDARLDQRNSPLAYVRATQFFGEAIARIRTVPGVDSVGAINGLPLAGEIWGKYLVLFDRPLPASLHDLANTQYRVVVGDYFRALGIRVAGRAFTDADTLEAQHVAIVNRELAHRFWTAEEPLGKIISVNPPIELVPPGTDIPPDYRPSRLTVVGVADDVHYGSVTATPLPVVYVPYAQGSEGTTNMSFAVRASGDPRAVVGAVREQIRAVDKDLPVANVQTMDERLAEAVAQPRLETIVFAAFALVAMLLAAVGLYGVTSYAVTERTREIGVRLALGAAPREILSLVVGQAFAMVGVGVVAGLAAAVVATRGMRSLLYQVSATDSRVFAAIVALVVIVAFMATILPAMRAARVDPSVALRCE